MTLIRRGERSSKAKLASLNQDFEIYHYLRLRYNGMILTFS